MCEKVCEKNKQNINPKNQRNIIVKIYKINSTVDAYGE